MYNKTTYTYSLSGRFSINYLRDASKAQIAYLQSNVSVASYIGDQHRNVDAGTSDRKSNSSFLSAFYPATNRGKMVEIITVANKEYRFKENGKNRCERVVPPILYWHIPSFPDSDLLERFDRKHEMLVRRVTVSASLGRETIVGRTEVRGGDDNGGPRDTPAKVIDAAELEAGTTDLATLEE
ncbi:hypothetical protein G2W53_013475 [Senna tora]|uniref:Uncharacterized protein n=1 Tax=Senna tora TaxID=362788 RepID=A0A834WQM3_9FABA|nr:hypothetical protein G2W53_013475 [Senna tora]